MESVLTWAAAITAALVFGWLAGSRQARLHKHRADTAEQSVAKLENQVAEQNRDLVEHRERAERLSAELAAAKERIKSHEDLARVIDEKLPGLTAEALQKAQNSLLEQANEKFTTTITPITQALTETKALMTSIEGTRQVHFGSITTELSNVQEACSSVLAEATGVKKALLGDSKARGDWGEYNLRKVLEEGGLAPHFSFTEQEPVTDADGKTKIPDCKIKLPDGGILVVDSKVSLNDYVAYSDADTERDADEALKRLAASIKNHAKALADKDYQGLFKESVDAVVMFVPGEHFISAAVKVAPDIFDAARRRKVIIATPNTLLLLVKCVELMWSRQKLSAEAQGIGELARQFHDRLVTIQQYMNTSGNGLATAVNNHNHLVKSFDGMLIPASRKFKKLGVEVTKEFAESKTIEIPVSTSVKPINDGNDPDQTVLNERVLS